MVIFKKMVKVAMISMILLVFGNCCKDKSLFQDDELSISRQDYVGDQLRLDGYYRMPSTSAEWSRVYFFYRNGVIIEGYLKNDTGEFEGVEEHSKSRYGVFQINGTEIEYEKWYPSSGGGLPAYLHSGTILNDTSFRITRSVRIKTGDEKPLNDVYQFKRFSPKPDSTNEFID